MPIYEYEPDDRDCLMCKGRIEVLQGVNDPPLRYCPYCGLEVVRVVSRPNFQMSKSAGPDKAAKHGFTTFRRMESGRFEKIAGEGPDLIVKTSNQKELEEAAEDPANEVYRIDE